MPFPHPLPVPTRPLAPLRGRVFEPRSKGWPGSARRRRRGTFTRPVSPCRALRRWGAGRPTGPRAFSVPGGEAFLGSPCRGSLRCAALGRHARPSGLSATAGSDGEPPSGRAPCIPVPGTGPHMPLRGHVSASDGLLPRPRTPGRVRPRKALRRAYTASEEFPAAPRREPHLRPGKGCGAAPRKCDDTHDKKWPPRLAFAP